MAGVETTAQLDQTVNTINAKAILTMDMAGVFPGVFDKQSVPGGARSYTEPKLSRVTAYSLLEGVDMSQAQQITDTLTTVTPAEVGVQVIYTRIAQMTRSSNIVDLITEAITRAITKERDVDGTEQMDNFATSFGSGSTTTLAIGYLSAAIARIRGNTTEATDEPLSCVVHPYTYNDLVDTAASNLLATGGTALLAFGGLNEEFARKYVVGSIAGMPILTDANLAMASNAAKGGVFAKRACVYAELWGIEVAAEEDKSLRGVEQIGRAHV